MCESLTNTQLFLAARLILGCSEEFAAVLARESIDQAKDIVFDMAADSINLFKLDENPLPDLISVANARDRATNYSGDMMNDFRGMVVDKIKEMKFSIHLKISGKVNIQP